MFTFHSQKDAENLKTLLLENHDLSRIMTEQELAHHRSLVKKTDIVVLERLRYQSFYFILRFSVVTKYCHHTDPL